MRRVRRGPKRRSAESTWRRTEHESRWAAMRIVMAACRYSFNRSGGSQLLVGVTSDGQGGYTGTFDIGLSNVPTSVGAIASASAASYRPRELAVEAIGALFGSGLATGTTSASTTPLPTELGGVQVRVRDAFGVERVAPLFFVSPAQINFQVPADTSAGTALLSVLLNGAGAGQGTAAVAPVAPGLFAANATGQGVASAVALRVRGDGTRRSRRSRSSTRHRVFTCRCRSILARRRIKFSWSSSGRGLLQPQRTLRREGHPLPVRLGIRQHGCRSDLSRGAREFRRPGSGQHPAPAWPHRARQPRSGLKRGRHRGQQSHDQRQVAMAPAGRGTGRRHLRAPQPPDVPGLEQ